MPCASRDFADSRWLAWSHRHSQTRLNAIYLYDVQKGALHEVTSGRFDALTGALAFIPSGA